jgi:hypothetical protein
MGFSLCVFGHGLRLLARYGPDPLFMSWGSQCRPYVDSQEQSYDFCCHDIFLVSELGCNVLQNKGNPPGGRTPTVIATFASFDQHVYGGRPPEGYLLIVSKVA